MIAYIILITLILVFFIIPSILAYILYKAVICPSSDKSMFLSAPHNKSQKNDKISSNLKKSKLFKKLFSAIISYFNFQKSSSNYPNNNIPKIHKTDPLANQETILKKKFKDKSKNVFITSHDGLKLHALILENKQHSDKWVIMCHGYSGNALRIAPLGKIFYDFGFNILAPNARGHGKSEGAYIGMGWHERFDILQWIDKIISTNANAKIALYGISMGAATVMMTSGEKKLPNQVKCIIEDCGYTSAWDEFKYQFKKFFKISSFPILNLMSLITKLKTGYSFKEASAINQIKKSHIPILFIHGSCDTFVPTYMLNDLYNAANYPKEKLLIEGASHTRSHNVAPQKYESTIKNFTEKYI